MDHLNSLLTLGPPAAFSTFFFFVCIYFYFFMVKQPSGVLDVGDSQSRRFGGHAGLGFDWVAAVGCLVVWV